MNLGAVVPLISGTTAHPSGTTAGGAEHGTKNAVAVLPADRSGTTAHRGGTTAYRRNYRALLPCNYCKTRHEKCKTQNRGGTSAEP